MIIHKKDTIFESKEGQRLFRTYYDSLVSSDRDTKEINKNEHKKISSTSALSSRKYNTLPNEIPLKKQDKITNVTIDDLLNYYKHKGVIGEEKNLYLQTLSALNGISFGIEGLSGSGKTFLTDKLMELIPEDYVYIVGLSSNLAILNDSETINQKKFIYIPEIQKAMGKKDSPIVEIIKDLTEGKDAMRLVTKKNGDVLENRIKSGITVIYTLASESYFKKDIETSRRFLRLYTDHSKEHIDKVLEHKANSRISNYENEVSFCEHNLKQHIKNCIDLDNMNYIDPFAPAVRDYIPSTPKTVSYVDHFYKLLNASAKFNHERRIIEDGNIFLNLEDYVSVFGAYYDNFCNIVYDIDENSQNQIVSEIDWDFCLDSASEIISDKYPSIYGDWKKIQGEHYGP